MNMILRKGLFLALALVLLAGFGCKKRDNGDAIPGDTAGMTQTEIAAAQQISSGVIYFGFDRYDLTAESKATLTQKAAVIKENARLRVLIEGHTDERGTEEYNLALGERRARAAYEFLINLGVKAEQLDMVSMGKLYPAKEGSGEAVWALNRRCEFKVSLR